MTKTLKTVSAYQSLLKEDDYDLKEAGLKTLLANVNQHWGDIANDITDIEKLFRDPKFSNKSLAAILLSKLYFNLNDYKQALHYALQSGSYFNIEDRSDYSEVLVNKCIEHFIQGAKEQFTTGSKAHADPLQQRYKEVVDKMVEKSMVRKEHRLPLGIALESRDIELAKRVIAVMDYHELVECILQHLDYMDVTFRDHLLKEILSKNVTTAHTPVQYMNILILLKYANDYSTVATMIYELAKKSELDIAYTLALEVSQMHGFNRKVSDSIPTEAEYTNLKTKLVQILQGELREEADKLFLKKFANTDPHYLGLLKAVEAKTSVAHCSAILAMSMLQAYTEDDSFIKIKENFEWAAKATHWSKYASIGSLGIIFKNCHSIDPVRRFMPESNKDVVNHFPNGGAFYALGFMYSGTQDKTLLEFLRQVAVDKDQSKYDAIMHGLSISLGLLCLGTGNKEVANQLKDFMHTGNSVLGEAAGLSIGLIHAGSGDELILGELINMTGETDSQKSLRSVCMSIGIVCFQKQQPIEFLENLAANPKLKLAVPHYLAMAYFKTSNLEAVKKLLEYSNDISNEVKRAAVIALGFVLYQQQHLIHLIQMMIYSYNPSIRYACAIALAVGAKESKEVLDLLWPLLTDAVDYVRQAAYISVAILLQTVTAIAEPRVADFRKMISESVAKKHEEVLAKMGAILALGLLDIGGRNMMVQLTTRSGIAKMESCVSMLVFTNFWNWFPHINFIGMTLVPSAYIGITTDLKIPTTFELRSTAKPGTFDYPPLVVKEEKKEEAKKDTKVQLSTTNKVKARANKKKGQEMEIEPPGLQKQVSLLNQMSVPPPPHLKAGESSMSIPDGISKNFSLPPEPQLKQEQKKHEQKKESLVTILKNPHRVTEKQRRYLQIVEGRYHPVLPDRKIGINFLRDSKPGEPDEYLGGALLSGDKKAPAPKPAEPKADQKPAASQAQPPEDFVFSEEDNAALLGGKKE